jgi:hypothetical protein
MGRSKPRAHLQRRNRGKCLFTKLVRECTYLDTTGKEVPGASLGMTSVRISHPVVRTPKAGYESRVALRCGDGRSWRFGVCQFGDLRGCHGRAPVSRRVGLHCTAP